MNRNTATLCAFTVVLAVGPLHTGCDSSDNIVNPPEQWVLTMADEFDSGTSPSAELWTIETGYGAGDNGWGNDESQEYTTSPDNVRVEGGNLVITAQCPVKPCGERDGSITSARITTQNLFQQERGRVEARIKLPAGQGLWPAFWMLGANIDEVPWPGCGEIDIMEYQGQRPERVFGSLHGPGYSGGGAFSRDFDELPGGETFADDFHVLAVEWDPDRIAWWVDDEVYGIITSPTVTSRGDWVFNNEFFVLLNLAVGGTLGGRVDDTVFPAEMLVDYVRIFERAQ